LSALREAGKQLTVSLLGFIFYTALFNFMTH
jgi:hypothetical protein